MSSSEEGLFGKFLEELAVYVVQLTSNGQKSAATGLDIEFERNGTRYLLAIKSGPSWGNSDQYQSLKANFLKAVRILKQSSKIAAVQPVLGICYGHTKTTNNGAYLKLTGQAFWEFVSGEPNFYIDLIEPLGYEARRHNENYLQEKDKAYNRFVREFTQDFCDEAGQIDWPKLVRFNSQNLP